MTHPKAIGDRSTLAAMLALESAGLRLLLPFGENSRYDLVIDDGVRFSRVQCKTGRLKAGAVRFKVCSSYAHHSNPEARYRDYRGEIDYFAVYCPDTGGVYLVPIEELPLKSQANLRVQPARNSQRLRTRPAHDYEIAGVMLRGAATTEGLGAIPGAPGSCA